MPLRDAPTELTAKVGARIRSFRVERSMTQGEFADACKLAQGHLSGIENGLNAITIETVARIANGLGVPPMYLLAFPEEDLRCRIVDQVRDQPATELRKLEKELVVRFGPRAKASRK